MKKTGEIVAVLSVLFATLGVIVALLLYERHRTAGRDCIELEARAVSTWSTTEITTRQGKLTRIRIRNVDNVSHGFAIPQLNVPETIIRAGHIEIVEFTPAVAGEFVFMCVVQCSRDRHEFMKGKIIVTH